ncbi:Protein farnesyltransferase subunit beta [Yarrowia sp. B02]|nr:Protein farnesyltransferase subunit beta [Yarrowia sp. B02]
MPRLPSSILDYIAAQQNRHKLRNMTHILTLPIRDSYATETSELQNATEHEIVECLEKSRDQVRALETQKHLNFLDMFLNADTPLPDKFTGLDASRAWLLYWSANAIRVLGGELSDAQKQGIPLTLQSFKEDGVFGGGSGQNAHAASTYAAFLALADSDDEDAWGRLIRPEEVLKHNLRLKSPDGGFASNVGGETDVRGTYCRLVVASLTNTLTEELTAGVIAYIASCQSYEGGFGGSPGNEAHAGYTYCALAALAILVPIRDMDQHVNVESCLAWLSARQYQPEGGFSGRTNKLVDACYAYWVGASLVLINGAVHAGPSLWDRKQLAQYVLNCCQQSSGGLRDKPGCKADAYHTNYAACGIAMSQYIYFPEGENGLYWQATSCDGADTSICPVNPVYGVPLGVAERMRLYFTLKEEGMK